jgi:REP element-mobilizing transposase RayT
MNLSIIQFVTVTVRDRRPILANPQAVELLTTAWSEANHWFVGRYVIMPDHLHFTCSPVTQPPTPLAPWMKYWRSIVTRNWPDPAQKPLWQKDYFDRQLRSGESYVETWDYIWNNPVRAGLVTSPQDWPYQGELNVLLWREPEKQG